MPNPNPTRHWENRGQTFEREKTLLFVKSRNVFGLVKIAMDYCAVVLHTAPRQRDIKVATRSVACTHVIQIYLRYNDSSALGDPPLPQYL